MKHVYVALIGGLPGVILDHGMHELDKKIEALAKPDIKGNIRVPNCRFTVETFPWFLWKRARNKAIDLWDADDLDYLMVCGHSWGCLKAVQLAADVAKHGIHVRYIAAIDPTAGPEMAVPGNVEFVDEFWAKWGFPAHARGRDRSGGQGGMYVYPFDTPRQLHPFNLGHIPIGSSDDVHQIITDRITGMFT